MSSPAIQQIDKTSVHKICSGQVVLDLATAVKELVENSLDAESKNVEIRLKEYGKELIEVCDDGLGIAENNFEGLALKHHTSKLREFNDLTVVDTYGFRGEALSSLSALGNLSITTQNLSSPNGFKLQFEHSGELVSTVPFAREYGTTVSVTDLFYTLPVRHKEFQRNFKKDFVKLCHVIYAYTLVNSQVRFTCTNVVGKKKNVIASTKGNQSTLDVITSLFGISQSKKLQPFTKSDISEDILEDYNLQKSFVDLHAHLFDINGYISSVAHGSGRSSPDRQFYFVNTRPCDYHKLSKVVNEMYHKYNNNQYPFVHLEVSLKKDLVDVNITPDKRQVMVQQEKVLYAIVKSSLKEMFDKQATLFPESNEALSQTLADSYKNTNKTNSLAMFRSRYAKDNDNLLKSKLVSKTNSETINQPKLQNFFQVSNCVESKKRPLESDEDEDSSELLIQPKRIHLASESVVKPQQEDDEFENQNVPKEKSNVTEETLNVTESKKLVQNTIVETKYENGQFTKPRVKVIFSLKKLKDHFSKKNNAKCDRLNDSVISFHAKIAANENSAAEAELAKNVTKSMFREMKVIGQFNLGFIIAMLKNDLFIVDQHATDEKYNFETLQKKHVLKTQTLIQPIPLEFTPVQKSVLVDNINIFKKNGFAFDISDQACYKIISAPVHRNWTFGVSDVEELIFLLSDSPGMVCRPSRVRQMFASRSCRTAIMIGTALSKQKMKELLMHMGEIEHPWNCPHGRPTMRHLISLKRLNLS